jgi:hypothetical protein
MKKISILTITLALTCTVLFGCDKEETVDKKISSDGNTTAVTENSEIRDLKSISEDRDKFLEQGYIMDKEIQNIELNLKEIDLSEKIKGKKVSVSEIIDKENYLITLSGTLPNYYDDEYGFYNIKTKEYRQLVTNETGIYRNIVDYNENYVIYYEYLYGEAQVGPAEQTDFCIKYLNDDKSHSFFKIELKDGYDISQNSPILVGDKFYFDTFQYTNNEQKMNVYCYDIKKDSVNLVKEEAQYPVLVGEEVYVITKDENDEYRIFSSLYDESAAKYVMPFNGGRIASNGESVFMKWFETHDENMMSRCVIKDITKDQVIFSTYMSVDNIYATDKYLTWGDVTGICKPSFYDIKNEKMLVIDSINEMGSYNIQFAKDGTALLSIQQEEVKFYTFEY